MAGPVAAAVTHQGALDVGAFAFGMVIGWNIYFINRYRKDVVIGDLAALIGAIGGSAILTVFEAKTLLFAYYGMGLAAGFFSYFLVLLVMVFKSSEVGIEWFLTGKGKRADDSSHPMVRGTPGAPEPFL
jgi:hypothetical protein